MQVDPRWYVVSRVDGACFQLLKLRVELKGGQLLSTFAFNFNLRRHTAGTPLTDLDVLHRLRTQGEAVQVEPIKPILKAS